MKDSFILYNSFYEPIKSLSDEQLGKLFRSIFDYMISGKITEENDIKIAFLFIKNQLDIDITKWEETRKKRSEAGKKHKGNQYSKLEQMEQVFQNGSENENVNVNDNVLKEKDNNKLLSKKKSFKKPTLEEVKEYCKERNNNIDAQTFIDFYESKDWMIGKNKMKDWKACIRTWERSRTTKQKEEIIPNWFNEDLGRGGFEDDGENF